MKQLVMAFVLATAAACGSAPPPVDLSGRWPERPAQIRIEQRCDLIDGGIATGQRGGCAAEAEPLHELTS